ncbi:MAG: hypothetical protein ACREEF_10925 [Brevundimonas sp.]
MAEKLGVQRFAVSKWRARESVPAKYRVLYSHPSKAEISNAVTTALRFVMMGKPERSYWLAASLSVLPSSTFDLIDETEAARGLRLERAILDSMNLAMTATNRDLGKEWCADEDDYRQLVSVLRDRYADDVARIASRKPRTGSDDALQDRA